MRLAPPGPGLRPAGQGIGQISQREILRFPRPEVQHQPADDLPVSTAIRDRLTQQFSQRYDEKTALEAELQAIEDAAPLPDSDLSLIDELPHALGLLAQAPDDLRELLAAALGLQAIYRPDTRQATIVLTITDNTPATVNAILADPPHQPRHHHRRGA